MTHPIDAHVGKTLKTARKLRGMSQTDIALKLGVSFQQIQKYELGSNRIAASRLFELAQALDMPPALFFPETQGETPPVELTTEEATLIRSLRSVDPSIRAAVTGLCVTIAEKRA
jgi:transcriptional regulator with XRE-family HTH domain